mgnify:CR=1 FL=1
MCPSLQTCAIWNLNPSCSTCSVDGCRPNGARAAGSSSWSVLRKETACVECLCASSPLSRRTPHLSRRPVSRIRVSLTPVCATMLAQHQATPLAVIPPSLKSSKPLRQQHIEEPLPVDIPTRVTGYGTNNPQCVNQSIRTSPLLATSFQGGRNESH